MAIDDLDRQILDCLRSDGRMPLADIARRVGLSPAPVARRIERMEATGVILGYTAVINDSAAGTLEAFTELRLVGSLETDGVEEITRGIPEVVEYFTIAGDPDVLLRIRVRDADHLQQVVNSLRRTGKLAGTKTLIVLKTWNRAFQRG